MKFYNRYMVGLEILAMLFFDWLWHSRSCFRYDTWEIEYNHHNRMSLSLPNTYRLITTQVRWRGMSDWNIFYEILTHAGPE
jgi:hypothetical protein